jgi:hypothetical protein
MRAAGMTTTAVPTQNTSRSVPRADSVKSSDTVRARPAVCRRVEGGSGGGGTGRVMREDREDRGARHARQDRPARWGRVTTSSALGDTTQKERGFSELCI